MTSPRRHRPPSREESETPRTATGTAAGTGTGRATDSEAEEPPPVRAALADLSHALAALVPQLGDAVRDIERTDVEHVLQAMPVQRRRQVLGALRMPVASTRVGPALCRDLLARLRREPDSERARHAVAHLTQPLLGDLVLATVRSAAHPDQAPPPLTRRWSPALLRLALWSALRPTAGDARIWLWALDQPWLAEHAGAVELSAVREAARRLVDLTPELDAVTGGPPAAAPAAAPDATGLAAAVERLTRALADAGDPLRRLTGAIGDGARPADADIGALTALADAFDDALAGLTAHGATEVRAELAAVRHHTADVLARLADGELRERLGTVGRLTRTEGSVVPDGAVPQAHERARALLARPTWDERERADAAALGTLLTMVGLARDGDRAGEILELLAGMSRQAPWLLPLAAQHAGLELADPPPPEPAAGRPYGPSDGGPGGEIRPPDDEGPDDEGPPPPAPVDTAPEPPAREPGAPAHVPHGPPAERPPTPAASAPEPPPQDPTEPRCTAPAPGPGPGPGDTEPLSAEPQSGGPTPPAPGSRPSGHSGPTAPAPRTTPTATTEAPDPDGPVAPDGPVPEAAAYRPTAHTAPGTPEPIASAPVPVSAPVSGPGARTGGTAGHTTGNTGSTGSTADADGYGAPPRTPTGAEATALARLVGDGRHGLAAALAEQAGEPAYRVSALRISAYSNTLDATGNGTGHAHVRSELACTDLEELAASRPETLLLTAALLRTVLVTGDPETGAPLGRLAGVVSPALATVAREVSQRALQSTLLHAPPLALARDAAGLERALQKAREECRQSLEQHPRLRFNRASDIARQWLARDGLLGWLLHRAAADDRGVRDEVAARVRELSGGTVLQDRLGDIDRRLMKSSRTRLEGAARQNLLRLAQNQLRLVERWVACSRALDAGAADWGADQVQEMRATVLGLRDRVAAELAELPAAAPPDGVGGDSPPGPAYAASAHRAAADSLALTFRLLSGEDRLAPARCGPAPALGAELLRIAGVRLDTATGEAIVPATGPGEFLAASHRAPADAVRLHTAAERYDVARRLLDTVLGGTTAGGTDPGDVPSPVGELCALVADAGRRTAAELEQRRRILEDRLRRARVNEVFQEPEERAFEHRLRAVPLTPVSDLAGARARLDALAEELERANAGFTAGLRARLAGIPGLAPEDAARVTPLLDEGDLLTAHELISSLAVGEAIPDTRQTDHALAAFSRFFPAVPDALPDGVTEELIDAVRRRERHLGLDALDFSAMSPEFAEAAAQGLAGWRDMASREGARRLDGLSEESLLMPALRLIGYRSTRRPQRDQQKSLGREYRFLDVPDVTHTGEALVPDFGSGLRGRLRVMLVWGQPAPEALLARVRQDPGQGGLLVAYFGTLSAAGRARLASECIGGRPLLVLDDAALAHLAARGNQLLGAAMRVLLPFSAVNPYVSEKRGRVAEEMFFGRSDELKSVQLPAGNQVLFGGRGLGKSALLREAARQFERGAGPAGGQVGLVLSLDSTYTGTNAPSATIWHIIGRELLDRGALVMPRKVRSDATLTYEQVLAGIRGWLRADSGRRMLIMLDEADGFFEADSPRFTETRRLRDLSARTDDGVKVVLAGLHSVQRYATLAVNNPFSHLSQHPEPIGPLEPQAAADLLIGPLTALGHRFEEPTLVHRILGHCSYQPFLLQMFVHRLVQTMHERRRGAPEPPPYRITRADVEQVQSDKELQRSITGAFHDTLRLDSRYNVIANVVALHAYHQGLGALLTHAELRSECTYWWSDGFRDLDPDQFRAYLTEMEGLGVLAPDPDHRGWHLRGANALNMIGTLEDVEAQLQNAASREITERLSALESRHTSRATRTHSPLTAAQVAQILPGGRRDPDRRNLARVVVGTPATGIDRVAPALREIAESTGWTMPPVVRRSDFERELTGGTPGRGRVVVSDLHAKSPVAGTCLSSLESAQRMLPERAGVTRSAVIVAGPRQRALWFLPGEREGDIDTVPLRRFTASGLRTWALDMSAFTSEAALERLTAATGGWPLLVDRVAAGLWEGCGEREALRSVAEWLDTEAGAAEFLRLAGLEPGSRLWCAYRAVRELMTEDGLSGEDVRAAVGTGLVDLPDPLRRQDALPVELEAAETVRALRVMQVFDVDQSGRHRLERVLLSCWPSAAGGAGDPGAKG
ncbi:hypothetical protein [Streptomyces yaizuensis]|uniref:AAA+ ATPase domain-containing protein n=1 Tax=Streptomyces yaizuensis TaxID=2989713 RepID=A0ABQ5P0E5_9ACTN|nr:hypothetical protein [Streptomyces sp. YSPA8]GLF95962.1 hypothetical protein SYYSPA8_16715 [Streptomyces sp. YSPA8]